MQSVLFPTERVRPAGDAWLVASKSRPGDWHRVDAAGRCDCLAYAHRRRCRHVTLLRELGHLAAPDPGPLPAVCLDWPAAGDPRLLWTSRYQNGLIARSGLVAVQTSLGPPRFKLAYPLTEQIPELTPDRWMLGLELGAYREAYLGKVARSGVDGLRSIFQAISCRHVGAALCLLCFEPVHEPGRWCHRRLWAEWWQARTGEEVPELHLDPACIPPACPL